MDKRTKYEKAADQLKGFLGDACGDAAYDMVNEWEQTGNAYSAKDTKVLNKAKKDGVRDLHGWFADELYNRKGLLQDLLGDNVYMYWTGPLTDEDKIKIYEAMLTSAGHTALQEALRDLIKYLSGES